MTSQHDHAKATGSATRTGKNTAGTIDADLAVLQGRVDSWFAQLGAKLTLLDARVTALENPIPDPDPIPDPEPVPPPTTVTVRSINDLYAALANNEPHVTLEPRAYAGSIEINERFAARTQPGIVVMTGATLDGGGGVNQGRIAFNGGAHDLDFRGLTLANSVMSQAGVIGFDGFNEPGVHGITLRGFRVLSSVRRTSENGTREHAVYFSHSQDGGHDILIENLDVDASHAMSVADAIHMDHADVVTRPDGSKVQLVNSRNVTVRGLKFRGNGTQGSSVQYPIILWTPAVRDWLFDGADIQNANGYPVRYESRGGANNVFRNIRSTGSRFKGVSTTQSGVTGFVDGGGNAFL